jgi:trehalose 6-phosphate synthase
VWLSEEEVNGYYYGFSNQALWPLCHSTYVQPVFDESQWNMYQKVNGIFAQSVLEEIGHRKALVFIQDYHLALLPRLIKRASPETTVAQFWHIPWPRQHVFATCPWQKEILDGLLGNDLLGFHTPRYCRNFLTAVNRATKARVNYEKGEATMGERTTRVCNFPISIDFEQLSQEARSDETKKEIERLKGKLGLSNKLIGIGIDRLDYTKGIPQRLMAIDRFLDKWPEYKGKVAFIEAGVPSRTEISDYSRLAKTIDALVNMINSKHGSEDWKPIITLTGRLPPNTLAALRSMADFCIVSSLHDGMNLVAKEFVASKYDNDGVLLLSCLTGAARELGDALLINPLVLDRFAASIKEALEMPGSEKRRRMIRKRSIVRKNNVYKWAAEIVSELAKSAVSMV